MMKNLLLTTAIAFAFTAPAYASGSHDGGHDKVKVEEADGHGDHGGHGDENAEDAHGGEGHADGHAVMMIGKPGKEADVTRTIEVTMSENDDGEMLFEPTSLDIAKGETIRFSITNKGELEHEFVIDTLAGNAEHKEMMAKMDMEHDDPNSVRLDEGGSGEVIWSFVNEGTFEFACLIPGHYESGMHGPITVSEKMAQADVEYSTGKIKKINAKSGKVTIVHGPLLSLDMPAMTMVFRADEAMIAKMSEGQNIEFVADRVKGKLTVTKMK
jgi:uncharacterized cupredoxin-like copper-binding protein|tara:strand:- start:518 stop:1327 length:810 start_codon:yes stop_codon:yes gene_type:complete